MENLQRIAVLMSQADMHTRGIFAGITRYARPLRAWQFHLGLPDARILPGLRKWKPHGIIATLPHADLEKRFASLKLPMVNCSSNLTSDAVHRVITDNQAVGRLAADYLLSRGYEHLAFCGETGMGASVDRYASFCQAVSDKVHCFVDPHGQQQVGEVGWRVSDQDQQLRQWLIDLPKPAGILACHDLMAMVLLEVCRQLHINVPGELAILGVDDDSMLCQMAYPTLSSVRMAHERIGFEAARLLDQVMLEPLLPKQCIRIGPLNIVTRQSTDALASDDRLVAQAVRYIQEHADQPIRVTDVVEQTTVSRRNLEMRFDASLGKSILEVIQQAHVDLACQLLSSTQISIEQIASASGFNSRERFSAVFHERIGQTPGSYRHQQQQ
jgi:LacI family transcriptional regulator